MHILNLFRSVARGNRGASAIEFALVVPVLFLLFFGIMEFSMRYYIGIQVESAMDQAARSGKTLYCDPALGGSGGGPQPGGPCDRKQYLLSLLDQKLGGLISSCKTNVSDTVWTQFADIYNGTPGDTEAGFGQAGNVVRYELSVTCDYLTPFFGNIFGKSYTNSAVAYVVNEGGMATGSGGGDDGGGGGPPTPSACPANHTCLASSNSLDTLCALGGGSACIYGPDPSGGCPKSGEVCIKNQILCAPGLICIGVRPCPSGYTCVNGGSGGCPNKPAGNVCVIIPVKG